MVSFYLRFPIKMDTESVSYIADCLVVRQVSSIFQPNCEFCEESTKFGTLVEYNIMNRFGY